MATAQDSGCTALTLLLLLTASTQAAPTPPESDMEVPLNEVSTTASLAPPPTTVKGGGDAFFAQLATEFIQEGRSAVDSLQSRLALLEELVWTGSSQFQLDPTSSDDLQKRDNLSPTQRVMVRREIMRRLRERAPQPVELPIGMRFKKFPVDDTTVPEFQDPAGAAAEKRAGGTEMSASRRAAIRAAIMRQLSLGRQPVELPGMRGGK